MTVASLTPLVKNKEMTMSSLCLLAKKRVASLTPFSEKKLMTVASLTHLAEKNSHDCGCLHSSCQEKNINGDFHLSTCQDQINDCGFPHSSFKLRKIITVAFLIPLAKKNHDCDFLHSSCQEKNNGCGFFHAILSRTK